MLADRYLLHCVPCNLHTHTHWNGLSIQEESDKRMRINIRDMDNPQLKPIQEINECGQSILIKYLSQTTRSSACYAITFSGFIPIANELKGVKRISAS